MHDSHVHGSCGDCTAFVAVFPPESRFFDWGYCSDEVKSVPEVALASLQSAILVGDSAPLRQNQLGIYRAEPDDACDFFRQD